MQPALLVQRDLVDIASDLGGVERLLLCVLGGLRAIEHRLAIVERCGGEGVARILSVALDIEPNLILLASILAAVAEQLLAIA